MKQVIKKLNFHFWGSIIALAILFLLVVFKLISFKTATSVTTTAEMYAIALTLIAIPFALKLFAYKIKKIPKGTDKSIAVKLYKNAYFLRLYIINVVVLGNIVLFALSGNKNFMWLSVISFIVYMFCKPSQQELDNIIQEDKNA
ncbi:MAG: hypothetical protein ACOYEG_00665 [Petrimonas sp.]|jgi:hypothetical protein|nr:MAG: hypothetical protein BWZ00_00741 [Bacteroidetes bacterium ADurb.BinA174]